MRKKKITSFVLTAALVFGLTGIPAYADTEVSIQLNGKTQNYDDEAILVRDTVLVPFKPIAATFDATVQWNKAKQTAFIFKDDVKITLVMGATKATVTRGVSSSQITLNEPAQIRNGRVLVPVRVLASVFGAKVNWNKKAKIVKIDYKSDPQP